MHIHHVQLKVHQFDEMKDFYVNTLSMRLVSETPRSFKVQVGASFLSFEKGDKLPYYHFACLMTAEAYEDIVSRILEKDALHHGESWKWGAKQFYFKDPDGNIVELLGIDQQNALSDWLKIVEIGLPVPNIEAFKKELQAIKDIHDGDSETFQFYGDQEGVLVLTKEGRPWFPTDRGATIHPTTVEVKAEQNFTIETAELPYKIIGTTF